MIPQFEGFLVVDLSNKQTFRNDVYSPSEMIKRIAKIRQVQGTKIDRKIERQVTFDQGKKLAETHGFPFFETSAKDNANVTESFVG